MGLFHVPARLIGPTGFSMDLSLLVDTGATFVVLPEAIADRLEVRPARVCPVRVAGGRIENWSLGEVRLELNGVEIPTTCLIAADGPALLGAVALESLLLAVDAVNQRLVPVTAFVLTAA